MSKKSSRARDEILGMAMKYFNDICGLKVIEHIQGCCAEFSDELGFVTIQILPSIPNNEVVMTSTNWEYQIQDFIQSL